MAPSDVEATKFIGDALFGQGSTRKVMHRAYFVARPADAGAATNLAYALFNQRDLDGASAAASTLVRLKLNEAVGHHLAGVDLHDARTAR